MWTIYGQENVQHKRVHTIWDPRIKRYDRQIKYVFYEAVNKPTHFRLAISYTKKHEQRYFLHKKTVYFETFSNNYQIQNPLPVTLDKKTVDEWPDMHFQIMRHFYAFRPNIRDQS